MHFYTQFSCAFDTHFIACNTHAPHTTTNPTLNLPMRIICT